MTNIVAAKPMKTEEIMKMYQVSRAEAMVQKAIYDLWFGNYSNDSLTTEDRIKMTEDFTSEYADPDKVKVDKPFLRHPMTYRKQFQRTATIAEVLGDFILRIDQVCERDEEYPIHGTEKVFMDGQKAQKRELSIYAQAEQDRAEALSTSHLVKYRFTNGTTRPSYSIDEADVIAEASLVGRHKAGYKAPTVAEFGSTLRKVKANPDKWATHFALKGYDYAITLRKIKRLDIGRVRECIECGEPFYAHDLRRNVCDLQHGIVKRDGKWVRSKSSHCEMQNAKKRSEKQRETA